MLKILALCAITILWPYVLIKRFQYVKKRRAEIVRASRASQPPMSPQYIDVIENRDGITYAKAHTYIPVLDTAQKQAEVLPDSTKTLEGKR